MKKRGYYSGVNSLDGQDFISEFLGSRDDGIKELDEVVLVLMKSEEIGVIVEEIIEKNQKAINPTITVEDKLAFWWIKAQGKIEIDLDIATELLGKPYSVYDFMVNVSSTVGRAYTIDNKFIITEELMGIEVPIEDRSEK